MIKYVFLVTFAIFALAPNLLQSLNAENTDPLDDTRSFGGYLASPGQFPYHVTFFIDGYFVNYCGGAILSTRWILTSAECFRWIKDSKEFLRILVGANSLGVVGAKYSIDQIVIHPDYTQEMEELLTNNIALIKTSAAIQFNQMVQPIELSTIDIREDVNVLVADWETWQVGFFRNNSLDITSKYHFFFVRDQENYRPALDF